ncbi:MAG: FecR family protein [Treponema sp.]|jgi:hypothetical protein|nr:FecR family protein [Treponema sp.]
MRKKQSTKSRAIRSADIAVLSACLLGTAVFLALFQADLNRSLSRLNETPVGSVAFQSRAALRRFGDRIIWDRLRRESPVYNGNFIRTAERSRAVIRFSGGDMVSLSENSLIRIFVEDGTPRIEFSRGSISVYTGESGGLGVFNGENQVMVPPGAALNLDTEMTEDGESVRVRAVEGSFSIVTQEGTVEAAAGTAFVLGRERAEGGFAVSLASANFLAPQDTAVPVEFTLAGASSAAGGVRIEIAGDRNFTQALTVVEKEAETDSTSVIAELPAGSWWWRAWPTGGEGGGAEKTGRFTVRWAPPPQAVSPAPEAVYYYQAEPLELRFQWTSSEAVQHHILEAADNPAMANPVLREEVRSGSLVSSRLGEGQWYWRVTPVFPAFYLGTVPPSPVVPFTVRREAPPEVVTAPEPSAVEGPAAVGIPAAMEAPAAGPQRAPAAAAGRDTPPLRAAPLPAAAGRIPADGYVVTSDALRTSRTIVFSWEPVAGADGYIFTLLRENASGERQPVASAETSAPSYALEDLSVLNQGGFVWQVQAVGGGPTFERGGTAGENRFTVDIPKPETPRVRDAGIFYGR